MTSRRVYIFLTIVITLCVQLACSRSKKAENPPPSLSADQIKTNLSQAGGLFKQREDVTKLRDAVDVLAKSRNWREPNFDVEWQYAKYSYFLGKQTKDEKEAQKIFGEGRDAGTTAARLEPGRPEGHFWLGANLGELARMDPMMTGIKSVGEIRSEMNKVLEIDPSYQNSSAYDALAQVELETRFTGGSAQKAADLIEKALTTEKDNTNLHLHLAMAYLQLDRDAEAKKHLEQILQMKPNPDFAIEYRECADKAKNLLATRF
jgi:tetratricopeptide (TPR) repeat protein